MMLLCSVVVGKENEVRRSQKAISAQLRSYDGRMSMVEAKVRLHAPDKKRVRPTLIGNKQAGSGGTLSLHRAGLT